MIHFMPPLPLVALLAWYWSSQVLNRCLPALRLEYFGSTAEGNTALPTAAGAAGAAIGLRAGARRARGGGGVGAALRLAEIIPLHAVQAAVGLGGFELGTAFGHAERLRWRGRRDRSETRQRDGA